MRRYAAGEFGNASPTWGDYYSWATDFMLCPKQELYHVRNRIAGGKTWYNLQPSKVFRAWCDGCDKYGQDQLYISAMAPTHLTLIQGEVRRSVGYVDLTYTTVKKPMRDALAECSVYVEGIMAVCLLKRYLCPASYEWLWHLLDSYEDHVVEFSTYGINWGTVPGYNTVFWETRKY